MMGYGQNGDFEGEDESDGEDEDSAVAHALIAGTQ